MYELLPCFIMDWKGQQSRGGNGAKQKGKGRVDRSEGQCERSLYITDTGGHTYSFTLHQQLLGITRQCATYWKHLSFLGADCPLEGLETRTWVIIVATGSSGRDFGVSGSQTTF